MSQLHSEVAYFAEFINAQPKPVSEAFQYCLCLMMVEAGKMNLVASSPRTPPHWVSLPLSWVKVLLSIVQQ